MIQATNDPFPAAPSEPAPRGRGCFFWGCMTVGIVGLLIGGCTAYAAYAFYRAVNNYTATTPVPVPVHEVKPGEKEAVQERVDTYEKAGAGAATLELSAADLNTLLVKTEPWFAGKVFMRVEGEKVFVDVSVPLKEIPQVEKFPFVRDWLEGRYFNGNLVLKPKITNGELDLELEEVKAAGKDLPEDILNQLETELRDAFVRESRSGKKGGFPGVDGRAESLEVRDGKIILKR